MFRIVRNCFAGRSTASVFMVLIALALNGCATNRKSTLILMGSGAVAGGVIGAVTAPKGESQAMHAALWGGVGAAVAGVAGLFLFDEQKKSEELEGRNRKLESDLKELREAADPKLISESLNPMGKALPKSISGLLRPGGWKLYKLDRWVEEGENRLIHHDQILEFTPATIAPRGVAPVVNTNE